MNSNESNIIGCATFGLDDIVSGSDGTIIKDHIFSLSCALLPGHPRGSIITGNQVREERIHSGLPWPPEAWIKKGEHLRRAPVSCVWRALVEARDSQARWEVGSGVSFPLAKILATHIINLSAPKKSIEKLSYVVTIPNDLDEYGQENLLSEMKRELEKRQIRNEVSLLWRPVAAALVWLHKAGPMMISVLKNNPDDFLLVLYLGPDGIECVTFLLAIENHEKIDYVLPRRKRQSNLSPLVGYDWIGRFLEEQCSSTREGGDGAFWQAFTKFPEVWLSLAGRDFQNENLQQVWGHNEKYALWPPDGQKFKDRMELVNGGPSKRVQSILKSSCNFKGSEPSDSTWPEQLTNLVIDSLQNHPAGRMIGMVVCGPLAPSAMPSWLKSCLPVLKAHGLITEKPWDTCEVRHIWLNPGSEAIAQGAVLFQERLNNNEPTYLDTLPKYFLLAKERESGRYKTFPLVDAPDVKGGMEYHPEPIKGRFEIHEDSRKVDIVIARDGRHEDLLKPVSCTEILDSEVCRPADGLSIAGASLVRHFVRTADNCEKALQSVNRNQKIIREIILGSAIRYCRKFADTWYESGIENEIKSGIKSEKQLSLWSNDTNEQRTKETPFRLLSFPFSVPAPKTMPVDIHVRIRPASGMAHMEVKPEDTSFLHGRSVFVDYQTMRPCQVEELITDAKGWPPLEELTPHPAIGIWNGIDELVNEIEQTTPQTKIFTLRLQQMYDFLKTQKPYSFPDGSRVNLPVLNQNGLPGSQVGENLIARFSVALRIHTSKIRSWNTKEIRKMITRATWLYGATPDNVNNCIMNYIKYKTATGTTCEAGSRSLMDTSNIQAIFEYIAKDIRERNVFPMQNIRAIKNILSLRSNGQEALHGTTTTIFMNALLNEIDKPKYHYTPKFFTCLSLLLFLLRYRKCDEQFLPYDSGETNEIIVKLNYHLPFMKANMVGIRYKKSVEAINGIIDYLNFKGKTTLIDTLNFLSDNENNENDE